MTHRLGPTPSSSREDSGFTGTGLDPEGLMEHASTPLSPEDSGVTGAGLDPEGPLEHISTAPVRSSGGQRLSQCPLAGEGADPHHL